MLGVVQGRCGWLMHEGGHHSLTGNISIDIPLQVVLYGVGCGMSAAFWRNQHNKHHATPQKIDHDVDLDTLPLVMFNITVKDGKQKGMMNKSWIRLQAYLFTPVSVLLVSLGWQFFLHPRHSFRTGRYHELASMAVRFVVMSHFLLNTDYGTGNIVLAYLFYVWVGSAYIFLNFAVSHTHKPVIQPDEDVSWVRYASDHTMNVNPGPFGWVNWWMSFLNYQIEHHLFPSMPQFRHPEVSPRVRALFEKHGVDYDSRDYFPAMYDTFKNLDNVGKEAFYG
jgi:fatty acid desaturase 2 (delta-6 desaturase)